MGKIVNPFDKKPKNGDAKIAMAAAGHVIGLIDTAFHAIDDVGGVIHGTANRTLHVHVLNRTYEVLGLESLPVLVLMLNGDTARVPARVLAGIREVDATIVEPASPTKEEKPLVH